MARKPKARRPKAATGSNEAALTKGELRKLKALRKSLGDQIADRAFTKWLERKVTGKTAAPVDKNAGTIASILGDLAKAGKLRIPRGGYLVTRGRGRVIVTPGGG